VTTTGAESNTSSMSTVSTSTSSESEATTASTSSAATTGSSSATGGLPVGCDDGVVDPGQYCFKSVWLPDLGEPATSKTGSAAALDIDGDGRDELIVETLGTPAGVNTPIWYDDGELQPGLGVVGAEDFNEWLPWDWDSDDRVDLVALPKQSSGEALVMRNASDGLVDAEHVVVSDQDEFLVNGSIVPIDADGDGVLEFLVAVEFPLDAKGAHLRKLVGESWIDHGSILPLPGCGASGRRVYADFDEDGHVDVAIHDNVTACKPYPEEYDPEFHRFTSLRADSADGQVALVGSFPTGGYGEAGMWAADFDGDEHVDVAIQLQATVAVAIHHGGGDGSFAAPELVAQLPGVDGNWRLDDLADFDGDGDIEFLGGAGERRFIVEDLGGSPNLVDVPSSTPAVMVHADLNGDGIADFLDAGIARTGDKFVMLSIP